MDSRLIQIKDKLKGEALLSPARDVDICQILSKELKRAGPDALEQLSHVKSNRKIEDPLH